MNPLQKSVSPVVELLDQCAALSAAMAETRHAPESGARLHAITGQSLRARLPLAAIGDICQIRGPNGEVGPLAEVIAVDADGATLLPYGFADGLTLSHTVVRETRARGVAVGAALLGCVLDGMGQVQSGQDDHASMHPTAPERRNRQSELHRVPLLRPAPDPLRRLPVDTALSSGVRAIDAALTLGRGQRVGIFAAAGLGKTSLLGMLARGTDAQICVIALIGERGREVREFFELEMSDALRARCVLVISGSERPAIERRRAAYVATAVAEHFREQGRDVLLIMDSLTRFARAVREIGLAAGEPPTRRGYPPSVFAELPQLLERAGNDAHGTMTAIYTVLVEGDDMNEPVADEVRSLLDGHIVLSTKLAHAGHYPAIDVPRSVSRVMSRISDLAHQAHAQRLRALISKHQDIALLVSLGEYKRGNDALGDAALDRADAIRDFLQQSRDDVCDLPDVCAALSHVVAS